MFKGKLYRQSISTGRKQTGKYLRNLREKAGLTQQDVAISVDMKYYTFISQIENGSASLQIYYWEVYALTMGVPVTEFARKMIKLSDPELYRLLPITCSKHDVKHHR